MDLATLSEARLAARLGQCKATLELEILRWLGSGRLLNTNEILAVNRIAQGVREHLVRVRPAWAALRAAGLVAGDPSGQHILWRPNVTWRTLEAA